MTKLELEQYCSELEDAIEAAYDALVEDDNQAKAEKILGEYTEEDEEEAEEEAEDEPEQKE